MLLAGNVMVGHGIFVTISQTTRSVNEITLLWLPYWSLHRLCTFGFKLRRVCVVGSFNF